MLSVASAPMQEPSRVEAEQGEAQNRRKAPPRANIFGWGRLDLGLLALVVGLALWMRLQFAAAGAPTFVTPDSDDYLGPAYDLAHGLGFDPELRRTPLYSIFVSAVLALGGNLASLALVQHALGVLAAAATYALGRATFGRLAGLLAGTAVALSGPLIIYEHYLMAESLFSLLLAAAALVLVVGAKRDSFTWLFSAGAATGLAALTRPIGQAAIPIAVGLPLLLAMPGWRRGLRRAVLIACGVLVVLAPWLVRTWAVHGSLGAEGALGQALIGRTIRHDRGFVYDDPRRPDPDPTRAAARRVIQQEASTGEPSGGTITARLRDELGLTQAQTSALLLELALDAISRRPTSYLASTAEAAWELFQGKNERLLGHWRQRTTRNWDRKWNARLVPLLEDELPAEGQAYERADALTSLFQPWRWRRSITLLFGLGALAALAVPRWRTGLIPAAMAVTLLVAAAALDGLVWRFRYPADPLIAVVASGGASAPIMLALAGAGRIRRAVLART